MKASKLTALLFMKKHSERVPNKNLRCFCGKPLFFWIFSTISKCSLIDKVILNTDSEEIAKEVSKHFDVIIHMRPDYLNSITENEANQIIEYDILKTDSNYFLQTHSTNPLLKYSTIENAIKLFFKTMGEKKCDSLFSVTSLKQRLYWKNGNPINHDLNNLIKTQELQEVMVENSCIYIFSKSSFIKNRNRIGNKPLLYPIEENEAIDIDTLYDFNLAELVMKNMGVFDE